MSSYSLYALRGSAHSTLRQIWRGSAAAAVLTLIASTLPAGIAFYPQTVSAADTVIFLTSGTSWAVPADFSSTNTVETIGGGGNGDTASSGGGGGGGGGYSSISDLSLTPGSSVTIQVGGVAGDTWFNAATCAGSSVCAKGGANASGGTAGAAGTTTGAVGTTKRAGGSGFNGGSSNKGGGGGGAGGKNAAGDSSSGTTGGNGDGGSGGAGGTTVNNDNANPGSNGTEYDSTHGSGGGGGGVTGNNKNGGDGGLYGAGGGGGRGTSGSGGAGKQGLIVITYTPTPTTATLTLVKSVTNDNGGDAETGDWTLSADGPTDISGTSGSGTVTSATVDPGSYNLSETGGPAGYTASDWVCTGTGTQDDGDTISLDAGETATCTITNDDNEPSLTLNKIVTNDNGGDADASEWELIATGPTGFSDDGPSVSNGASFDAGTYDLSESGPSGYDASDWVCTGGTQNDEDTVTVALGETVVCTITNDDIAPTITLQKTVVTLDGGTATTTDFQGKVDGNDVDWNVATAVTAGVSHTASEVAGVSGYDPSAWGGDCNEDGTITLSPGENATCTITNDDIAPGLTLQKIVTTDDGGEATVENFQGYIDGEPVAWNDAQELEAGTYDLSESNLEGYDASDWSCDGGSLSGNEITLELGQTVTCTITNDDIAPTLKLVKEVVTDNGGDAVPADWTLTAEGNEGFSDTGDSTTFHTVLANEAYNLTEDATDPESDATEGYEAGDWSCDGGTLTEGELTLDVGENVTCTITNNDQPGTLVIVKKTDDESGDDVFHFTVNGTGDTSYSNSLNLDTTEQPDHTATSSDTEIPIGEFDVNEVNFAEDWILADVSCIYEDTSVGESIPAGGEHIIVGSGQKVTCTFKNTKQTATLTITKQVINNNEGTKQPSDFPLFLDDVSVTTGSVHVLPPGTYHVTETQDPAYGSSYGGDCDQTGHLTLSAGDQKTCVIINNDKGTQNNTPPDSGGGGGGNGPPTGSFGSVLGASTGPTGGGGGQVLGASTSTCSTALISQYMRRSKP
ncbi:hypothetical protein HY970_03355, partial [Candidatus Kaiserbacteria bacterium]|nr:hypothetical protein [Candidatus Kaiserbacteria bacterium]